MGTIEVCAYYNIWLFSSQVYFSGKKNWIAVISSRGGCILILKMGHLDPFVSSLEVYLPMASPPGLHFLGTLVKIVKPRNVAMSFFDKQNRIFP